MAVTVVFCLVNVNVNVNFPKHAVCFCCESIKRVCCLVSYSSLSCICVSAESERTCQDAFDKPKAFKIDNPKRLSPEDSLFPLSKFSVTEEEEKAAVTKQVTCLLTFCLCLNFVSCK